MGTGSRSIRVAQGASKNPYGRAAKAYKRKKNKAERAACSDPPAEGKSSMVRGFFVLAGADKNACSSRDRALTP